MYSLQPISKNSSALGNFSFSTLGVTVTCHEQNIAQAQLRQKQPRSDTELVQRPLTSTACRMAA